MAGDRLHLLIDVAFGQFSGMPAGRQGEAVAFKKRAQSRGISREFPPEFDALITDLGGVWCGKSSNLRRSGRRRRTISTNSYGASAATRSAMLLASSGVFRALRTLIWSSTTFGADASTLQFQADGRSVAPPHCCNSRRASMILRAATRRATILARRRVCKPAGQIRQEVLRMDSGDQLAAQ